MIPYLYQLFIKGFHMRFSGLTRVSREEIEAVDGVSGAPAPENKKEETTVQPEAVVPEELVEQSSANNAEIVENEHEIEKLTQATEGYIVAFENFGDGGDLIESLDEEVKEESPDSPMVENVAETVAETIESFQRHYNINVESYFPVSKEDFFGLGAGKQYIRSSRESFSKIMMDLLVRIKSMIVAGIQRVQMLIEQLRSRFTFNKSLIEKLIEEVKGIEDPGKHKFDTEDMKKQSKKLIAFKMLYETGDFFDSVALTEKISDKATIGKTVGEVDKFLAFLAGMTKSELEEAGTLKVQENINTIFKDKFLDHKFLNDFVGATDQDKETNLIPMLASDNASILAVGVSPVHPKEDFKPYAKTFVIKSDVISKYQANPMNKEGILKLLENLLKGNEGNKDYLDASKETFKKFLETVKCIEKIGKDYDGSEPKPVRAKIAYGMRVINLTGVKMVMDELAQRRKLVGIMMAYAAYSAKALRDQVNENNKK